VVPDCHEGCDPSIQHGGSTSADDYYYVQNANNLFCV